MDTPPPNAWYDPWLPVRYTDGTLTAVSLDTFFRDAHRISSLGDDLTPLDCDALSRFLSALAGMIYRFGEDSKRTAALNEVRFPEASINEFATNYAHRFNLVGPQPFLQRWDKTQTDLLEVVPAKKSLTDIVKPLEQLQPHVPGASSSGWAIRQDSRDADTWPVIIQLLVTNYFEIKNGNGKDPWGHGQTKGSAGTVHVNPFAVFWQHKSNMAATILANTPSKWALDEDLPLFLDHSMSLTAIEDAGSITRFSYAKTLPLIAVVDGQACGFVVGSDETIAVPHLGKDEKDSLGQVHEGDHTRLYVETKKKNGPLLTLRGSFGARLSSTEGFERWFRGENGIAEAITRWEAVDRVLNPAEADGRANWDYAIFSETTDGKGTRQWADWSVVPASFAGAKGELNTAIKQLFAFAVTCRQKLTYAAKIATEDSRPPLTELAQTTLFNRLQPVVDALSADVSNDAMRPLREYADQVRRITLDTFAQATNALLTPAGVTKVANARAWHEASIRKEFNISFPTPTGSTKESA